jgi:hypothetical protein
MKVIKCACVRGITVHYAIVSLREANKCFCETNKVKAKCYSLLALPFHVKIYNSKLCQVTESLKLIHSFAQRTRG